MTKKRTPAKVKSKGTEKKAEAEGVDEAVFLAETEDSPGIHILGKRDLEHHFGISPVGGRVKDGSKKVKEI